MPASPETLQDRFDRFIEAVSAAPDRLTRDMVERMRGDIARLNGEQLRRLQERITRQMEGEALSTLRTAFDRLRVEVDARLDDGHPADDAPQTYHAYAERMERSPRLAGLPSWLRRYVVVPLGYAWNTAKRWFRAILHPRTPSAPPVDAARPSPAPSPAPRAEVPFDAVDEHADLLNAANQTLRLDDAGQRHTFGLEHAGNETLFVIDGQRYRVTALGMNASQTLFAQRNTATLKRSGDLLMATKTLPSIKATFSRAQLAQLCREVANGGPSPTVSLRYTYTGPKLFIKEGLIGSVTNKEVTSSVTFERVR